MSRESGKPGPSAEALFFQLIEVMGEEAQAHQRRSDDLIAAMSAQSESPHSSASTHSRYADVYVEYGAKLAELFRQHQRALDRASNPLFANFTDEQIDQLKTPEKLAEELDYWRRELAEDQY